MRGLATVKGWMPAEEAWDEPWCTGRNLWSTTFHDQRDLKDPVTMGFTWGEYPGSPGRPNKQNLSQLSSKRCDDRGVRGIVLLVLERQRGSHRSRHAGGCSKLVRQGHTSPWGPPKRNDALLTPDCSPARPTWDPEKKHGLLWATTSVVICYSSNKTSRERWPKVKWCWGISFSLTPAAPSLTQQTSGSSRNAGIYAGDSSSSVSLMEFMLPFLPSFGLAVQYILGWALTTVLAYIVGPPETLAEINGGGQDKRCQGL